MIVSIVLTRFCLNLNYILQSSSAIAVWWRVFWCFVCFNFECSAFGVWGYRDRESYMSWRDKQWRVIIAKCWDRDHDHQWCWLLKIPLFSRYSSNPHKNWTCFQDTFLLLLACFPAYAHSFAGTYFAWKRGRLRDGCQGPLHWIWQTFIKFGVWQRNRWQFMCLVLGSWSRCDMMWIWVLSLAV